MNYNNENKKIVAVDLHVHTPVSTCYQRKGDLTLEEHYLNVLKVFKDKNVKLLAITDHNTLRGYKKLIEIKDNLEKEVIEIKNSENVNNERLSYCLENLDLYNEVKLIPGVEFTAYPHIHILFLFDEKSDLNRVEEFLLDCGYDNDEKQGIDLVNFKNLNVEDAIEKAFNMGAITIAAHIDRETGLLYHYEQNDIRDISTFGSKYLWGAHVLKSETIEKLKNFKNLVFVKGSDFHNEMTDMEKRNNLMNLKSIDFEGLKDAFENNKEKIKLEWFEGVKI